MPRFTQLANTTSQQLVCFGSLSDYDEYIIRPSKKAQKHQIISEWDKILRILVSLALKRGYAPISSKSPKFALSLVISRATGDILYDSINTRWYYIEKLKFRNPAV